MRTITLGQGLEVSALGLGCMGMSEGYGPGDDAESLRVLDRAIELGVTFFDTADIYGDGANEQLLARWLPRVRDHVVVATKFGAIRDVGSPRAYEFRGDAAYVRQACEASLRRLHIDTIDLYYQHRMDARVPIEETVGAMAELVTEGKVRYLGLSEATPENIARADATHGIAALQSQWSLWSRSIEDEVVPMCRRLGIGIVPYAPLGRGFLTGRVTSVQRLAGADMRRRMPQLNDDNLTHNLAIVERVRRLAEAKGVSAAQLTLAWVMAQGDDVVPIPGTKRIRYLEENVVAADLPLSSDDLDEIEAAAPKDAFVG